MAKSKHLVVLTTYGAPNPAEETIGSWRELAELAADLSTIDEVDIVHVRIDWTGGVASYSDGGRAAAVARDAGWSYV